MLAVSNLEATEALAHRVFARSKNRLWLHAGHPLLEEPSVHLRDIADGPLVALRSEELGRPVSRAWMEAGLAPKIFYETASVDAVRSLVASRAAIAIACDAMYRSWSLEGGRIEVRDLADRCSTTDLGVAWRSGADLPAAVRCLRKVCDKAAGTLAQYGYRLSRESVRRIRAGAPLASALTEPRIFSACAWRKFCLRRNV
jgi:DNA-binding transcriptional LysR family regulator